MKLELTKRDRKLLAFLGIFVVVVGIAYWGIRPQLLAAGRARAALQEAEETQRDQNLALNRITALECYNEELRTLLEDTGAKLAPAQSSEQVEGIITALAMERELFIRELTMEEILSAGDLTAYTYAPEGSADSDTVLEQALALTLTGSGQEDAVLQDLEEDSSGAVLTGLSIQMRLEGDSQQTEAFLDALMDQWESIRLCSLTLKPLTKTDRALELSVELYMCEE